MKTITIEDTDNFIAEVEIIADLNCFGGFDNAAFARDLAYLIEKENKPNPAIKIIEDRIKKVKSDWKSKDIRYTHHNIEYYERVVKDLFAIFKQIKEL